jgi:hypothetical protein
VWKAKSQKLCNKIWLFLLSFDRGKHCVECEMSCILVLHNLRISWFLCVYLMVFLLWVRIVKWRICWGIDLIILTHNRKAILYTCRNQLILRLCIMRRIDISCSTQCFLQGNESSSINNILHNFWVITFHTYFILIFRLCPSPHL